MGTALTPGAGREAAPALTERVVLCYDGDEAGPRRDPRGDRPLSRAGPRGRRRAAARTGRIPTTCCPRAGPEDLAARIDEAPDFLAWLLEESRPEEAGHRRGREERTDLGDPRDRPGDPRHDPPARGVPQARAAPCRFPWRSSGTGSATEGGRPAGGPPGRPRGRERLLPDSRCYRTVGIPEAERALLPILVRGGELYPFDSRALEGRMADRQQESGASWPRFREAETSETVDFQRQIAHLTRIKRSRSGRLGVDEGRLEPTRSIRRTGPRQARTGVPEAGQRFPAGRDRERRRRASRRINELIREEGGRTSGSRS